MQSIFIQSATAGTPPPHLLLRLERIGHAEVIDTAVGVVDDAIGVNRGVVFVEEVVDATIDFEMFVELPADSRVDEAVVVHLPHDHRL